MSNNGGFTLSKGQSVAIDPRITFKLNLRSYEPDATYLERRKYFKNFREKKQRSPER
jgi:hypothetical protein